MALLIDDVLTLEKKADELVAQAHADAARADKKVSEDIEVLRKAIAGQIESRIAAAKKAAEAQFEKDLAKARAANEQALAAVGKIGQDARSKQADRIVARFRES